MRINTIRAAPIIATTSHGVRDFRVVDVRGIDLLDMVFLLKSQLVDERAGAKSSLGSKAHQLSES